LFFFSKKKFFKKKGGMAEPHGLTAVSVSQEGGESTVGDPLSSSFGGAGNGGAGTGEPASETPPPARHAESRAATVLRRIGEFSHAAHCGPQSAAKGANTGGDGDDDGQIDMDKVRALAFDGVPDTALMRGVYWRLLLGFLPPNRALWDSAVQERRALYAEFVRDLTVDPSRDSKGDDTLHPLVQTSESGEPEEKEHVRLTDERSSSTIGVKKTVWEQYFEDSEIQEEVDKDVRRTLPHLHFFNSDPETGSTEHYEALKRILFVYAKLNPGIRYVQGMNEILGPLYYVVVAPGERQLHRQQQLSRAEGMAKGEDADGEKDADDFVGVGKEAAALLFPESVPGELGGCEADAFFCFTSLMAEIRDNFLKTLDRSETGVQGSIRRFERLLRKVDQEVWTHLERQSINPQFYSFRWITLLLSQEFDLPDVLRLWDSCFADENRFDFFYFVCVGMLSYMREDILDGDFASNLKLLQNYPIQDVNVLIKRAQDVRAGMWHPPPVRDGFVPLEDAHDRQYAVAGDRRKSSARAKAAEQQARKETNYSSWGKTFTSLFGGGGGGGSSGGNGSGNGSNVSFSRKVVPKVAQQPVQTRASTGDIPARKPGSANASGESGADLLARAKKAPTTSNLFGNSGVTSLSGDDVPAAASSAPPLRKSPNAVPVVPGTPPNSDVSTPAPQARTEENKEEESGEGPRDDGGADPLMGVAYKVHPLE
jgi:TBC1 domain family member 13